MRIKGAALLARKHIVTEEFGAGAWAELFKDLSTRFPYFKQPVLATSIIPLTEFLSFHDELVRRFYGGQSDCYFSLGAQSARWAVTEGPYKSFIADRDFPGFVEFFPSTWGTYFVETSSYCTTRLAGDSIDFEAFELPLWHPYFEYFVVGYFKGALELICVNPIHVKQLQGGSGAHYHYRVWAGAPDLLAEARSPIATVKERALTSSMETIVDFVEEHLGTEIGLPDLARLVDCSPDHLARMFKKSFGTSLYQYVLQRRLERAKALLRDRGHSIAQVARACGFASQSHFSSVFKAKVGVTPGGYRRDTRLEPRAPRRSSA
jgi:AraC-like DNA-binding protein